MIKVVKKYEWFNFRRYGDFWVAKIDKNGKFNFTAVDSGITSRRNSGEAGELYIVDPVEGDIYAYGQKDYRKPHKSWYTYIQYKNGEFIEIPKTELISALNGNNENQEQN
jgi:hypothetical protein